jgi:hypothetical protein
MLSPEAVDPAGDLGPPGGHLTIDGAHSWFDTYAGIVLITVAALPFAALTVWVLARRRRHIGATPACAWRMSLAEVGLVYGTVPWVSMTMVPGSQAGAVPSQLSLVPLRDLLTMPAYQIVGNLLIFAAVGFLAPVRFAGLASFRRILALAAAGSALIETAQYVLPLDRVSSVDDVLLNTVGAGLAALASRHWWRTRGTIRVAPASAPAMPFERPGSRRP